MNKVSGYIKRKSMLYVTGVEYGDYTMNHIFGCAHGCKYPCYAFMLKRRFGQVEAYEDWLNTYIVSNTLDLLDKEIPKLKSRIRSVQLCFTTDPFMYKFQEIEDLSLAAIKKLNSANISCTVLSKGILPIELASYSKNNEYGITLVSLNEKYREQSEPGAAPYHLRLEALKQLHDLKCKTWVSIEPYPTPNIIDQDLYSILHSIHFADKIIFGRTNYSKEVTKYKNHINFYNEQAQIVVDFCKKNNISFHIKEGTIRKQ